MALTCNSKLNIEKFSHAFVKKCFTDLFFVDNSIKQASYWMPVLIIVKLIEYNER